MMSGRPILTQSTLNQHVTQLSQQDIIYQPIYDSANYNGVAGQSQLSFFTVPLGQGVTTAPGATGSKTIQDTNMNAAGQLTKGNAFYMLGQEVLFYPGILPETAGSATIGEFVNDVYTFTKNGVLTLTIGSNRQYLQDGPLGIFPPATRLAVSSGLAGLTTTATAANIVQSSYAVASGEIYTIVPLYIEATLGFQQSMTWGAVQPLPSGQNARIFSRMRGYLNRNAQ